jgi:hypothetical protein
METILTAGNSYRVNIFGFPNAAGLKGDELNLGLLDQRLGLEWYVCSHDHSMDTNRFRQGKIEHCSIWRRYVTHHTLGPIRWSRQCGLLQLRICTRSHRLKPNNGFRNSIHTRRYK